MAALAATKNPAINVVRVARRKSAGKVAAKVAGEVLVDMYGFLVIKYLSRSHSSDVLQTCYRARSAHIVESTLAAPRHINPQASFEALTFIFNPYYVRARRTNSKLSTNLFIAA